MAEEKIDSYKSELDKAKENCQSLKNAYELEKRSQEGISRKNAELKEKTIEKVCSKNSTFVNVKINSFHSESANNSSHGYEKRINFSIGSHKKQN